VVVSERQSGGRGGKRPATVSLRARRFLLDLFDSRIDPELEEGDYELRHGSFSGRPELHRRRAEPAPDPAAAPAAGTTAASAPLPAAAARQRGEPSQPVEPPLAGERGLIVEFGPSRSNRFAQALAVAHASAGECVELTPGRHRVSFRLGSEPAAYSGLAGLIERVRHWRASEVSHEGELVPALHAREMAACARHQLHSFHRCQFRFHFGVLPRCALCPLFDAQRALRDQLGENPLPALTFEIKLGPTLTALLRGEPPPPPDQQTDWQVPDFPPAHWNDGNS